MNIGSLLTRNAQYRPDHTAVVFEDQRLSFLDFNKRVNRLANALVKLEVRKGDKVATLLPNCLELLESYWAIVKIGAVIVRSRDGIDDEIKVPGQCGKRLGIGRAGEMRRA